MGKRRFATTARSDDWKHDYSHYANRGISSHTRGWDFGVEVVGSVTEDNADVFSVYLTSGSNGGPRKYIGTYKAQDLKGG